MKKIFTSKSSEKCFAIALVVFFVLAIFSMSREVAMAQVTQLSFPSTGTTAPTAGQSGNTLSFPSQTSASAPVTPPSLFSCAVSGNSATCLAYFVGYLVQELVQMFISLGATLITFGLQLSYNVYNSPMIQAGFGICLSLANLGFVLAIIVIAVATIFRSETYGYKKTLWRLIFMAILVNFGLVITAPIVNFANGMSTYFLNSIQGSSGTNNLGGLVNNLAKYTAPQAPEQPPYQTQAQCQADPTYYSNPAAVAAGYCNQFPATAATTSPSTSFMQVLESIFFGIIYSLVIAIAFFAIGALLFVRYIWLGVLLVLLPLAWLLWIFPKFSHEFGKWWSNFIKWSFFAPAALFFIWLALTIESAGNNSYLNMVQQSQIQQTANTPLGALILATGQTSTIFQFMDNIVIIGIMIGGLMAASSMTGKAGSFVVEQAKGVSGAIQGYTGKQVKKAARVTYQKAGGHKITTALQEGRFGLKYIPLVGRGASLAGRGLSNISSNEKLVEEAKKKVPKSPDEIRSNLRGSMNKEDQLAHIAKLVEMSELREQYKDKDGNLKDEMVGGKTMREFLNTNLAKDSDIAHRFGQVKMGGDADKAVGSDKAVREAEDAIKLGRTTGATVAELETATKLLDKAMGEFIEKMQKSDIAKINVNEVFQHDTDLSRALLRQFALKAPQIVAGALPKMKAKNLSKFNDMYEDVLQGEIVKATAAGDAALVTRLIKVQKNYRNSLARNATGFDGASGSGGGGTPHP